MLELDRRWARPAPTPAQTRWDAIGGVGAALLSVASVQVWHSGSGASLGWKGVEAYALFGLAALLLAFRRRLPLTTLLLVSAVFIVISERLPDLGAIFTIQVVLFVAVYTAWAWSRRPRRLFVTSGVVLVAMFGWLIWEFTRTEPPPRPDVGMLPPYTALIVYSLSINVIYFLGAMAWGHGAWRSAHQRAEIADRVLAERLAQDRDRESAVRAERVRIARDLHDVVAHHVSGIGVQAAGAGRIIDARPEDAREALGVIERSSRQAVQQMHQLVGLLRADDDRGSRGPQPGLDELRTLAEPDGRPVVTFRQVGEAFDVPPTIGLSLFRIAQEAVANLRRHARAAAGEVVLRFVPAGGDDPAAVEVEVIDDGRATDARATPDPSGGFGLTGIRERAAMHGGTYDIGPRPDGGFRVRVRIPVAT
ncbi:MAG: sensor histidine kinase [Aeromicrobium sp.]